MHFLLSFELESDCHIFFKKSDKTTILKNIKNLRIFEQI
jgi:hypothetical protein